MNFVSELLWFIHRTIFEFIPALIADLIIYFYLSTQDSSLFPAWLSALIVHFNENNNSFLKFGIAVGIVIITSLVLKTFFAPFFWLESKVKENLEVYPNYILFKNKIDTEFEQKLETVFSPREILRLIRYKIMEHHKEFNTYLWYRSTLYHTIIDIAGSFFFVTTILVPIVCLGEHIKVFNYLLLTVYTGFTFLIIRWLLWIKFNHINKRERLEFMTINNTKNGSKKDILVPQWVDLFILILFLLGGVLVDFSFAKLNDSRTPYLYYLSFILGVNFILYVPFYLMMIYVFLEDKSFRRTLMDAFISMRYGKELFGEDFNSQSKETKKNE